MTAQPCPYDLFLSYSSADRSWVEGWLLGRLEQAGLRICLANRDFKPGVPRLVNLEQAVEQSRHTLLILTANWIADEWTAFEALLTQTTDPIGRRQRLIPALKAPCNPPLRIAMLTALDFTAPEVWEEALVILLGVVQPQAIGTSLPPATVVAPDTTLQPRVRSVAPRQVAAIDVDLTVGLLSDAGYPVTIRSRAGEAHGWLLPLVQLGLQDALAIIHAFFQGARDRVVDPLSVAQTLGQALFDALIRDEVRRRYDASQEWAWQAGQSLRLRLHLAPPELVALPWELLYDQRQGEYLTLNKISLVRYIDLPRPVEPLAITLPLRILGLAAAPADLPPLDIVREQTRVNTALADLVATGHAFLHWLPGQSWRDLQRAMRQEPWHVLHVIGHGGFDPSIQDAFVALVDEEAATYRLTARDLARLLDSQPTLKLVILNACQGGRGSSDAGFARMATVLVQRGIPAVVAMQGPIDDAAAREFARGFYEAIADGLPVDQALLEARLALALAAGPLGWALPVLTLRAPDGILFQPLR